MKGPSIRFDKEAMLNVLLMHGEKVVVGIVALAACGLAWGGIDAVRSKSIRDTERPAMIESQARAVAEHIEREKKPPAEELRRPGPLTETLAVWKGVKVPAATALAPFDKPLAEELRKRTRPQVLPLEQLQAVAGIAEFAMKPVGDQANGPAAQITPYVIVTGLIPVQKQFDEYASRFSGVAFTDPKRDSPLWSDYVIERTTVGPDGREQWTKIDVAAAVVARASRAADGGGGMPPADFLMPAEIMLFSDKKLPPPCGPLPPKARGGWGPTGLHPWVVAELGRQAAERRKKEGSQEKESEKPDTREPFVSNEPADGAAAVGPTPQPDGQQTATVPYRLFRFVDTEVEAGKTYKYRVKFELWNPNLAVEPRHLENASLAADKKLPMPDAVTTAVTVPTPGAMLVRTQSKADTKLYRPGTFEILILGPGTSGGYALRSLVTDIGGLGNVDPKLNRVGEQRVRGEDIETNFVLVDARGRTEDRADVKGKRPPEPLELLWLRTDGSFEYVSAADSQPKVSEFLDTLQQGGGKPSVGKGKDEPPGKDEPKKPTFLNPRLFRGGSPDSKPDSKPEPR
jgi:hypothetical protein